MAYTSPYGNAANSTFDRYLEAEVLSADPVKLTTMLFRGCLEAIAAARRALLAGDIPLRSKQIVKAWDIVRELDSVLDHDHGGPLSRQLSELYGYVGQVLLDANSTQSDPKLAEAESLLTLLAEAWTNLPRAEAGAATGEREYQPISQAG